MKVLVTGATGYVGSRIIPHLLEQGYEVRAAMRSVKDAEKFPWGDSVEVVHMDGTDYDTVAEAVTSVDAVFYFLHSMAGKDFEETDREIAQNFARAGATQGVQRLVYLGGLLPQDDSDLSPHLRSRHEVEQILMNSGIPVVVSVRAGILIGGGSTSFELIRRLVERMPVIPIPAFMRADIQPISIADVLQVLIAALTDTNESKAVNAVGMEVSTYGDLARTFARVAKLKRVFVPLPPVPYMLVSKPAEWISQLPGSVVETLVPSMGEGLTAGADIAHDLFASLHNKNTVSIEQAMRRSVASAGNRSEARDDHDLLLSDPQWAGGDVVVKRGKRKNVGTSLWSKIIGTHRGE